MSKSRNKSMLGTPRREGTQSKSRLTPKTPHVVHSKTPYMTPKKFPIFLPKSPIESYNQKSLLAHQSKFVGLLDSIREYKRTTSNTPRNEAQNPTSITPRIVNSYSNLLSKRLSTPSEIQFPASLDTKTLILSHTHRNRVDK